MYDDIRELAANSNQPKSNGGVNTTNHNATNCYLFHKPLAGGEQGSSVVNPGAEQKI